MQHDQQHREAIKPTIKVKHQLTAEVFDDKVRPMGSVVIENGKITIDLFDSIHMASNDATANFIASAIGVCIEECYKVNQTVFEKRR
jgi:hypothetical protein